MTSTPLSTGTRLQVREFKIYIYSSIIKRYPGVANETSEGKLYPGQQNYPTVQWEKKHACSQTCSSNSGNSITEASTVACCWNVDCYSLV